MENTEQTPKTAPETPKVDGRFANVSLTPGSETHRRFVRLMTMNGLESPKKMVDILMDAYEAPHTDNTGLIEKLKERLNEVLKENDNLKLGQKSYEDEIAQLKLDLAAARNEANANAAKAMQIQTATDGAIVVKLGPVYAYFMDELVRKSGMKPEDILKKLFIEDLQNPLSNHFPGDYSVSSARIRRVMEQLKAKQNEQQQ